MGGQGGGAKLTTLCSVCTNYEKTAGALKENFEILQNQVQKVNEAYRTVTLRIADLSQPKPVGIEKKELDQMEIKIKADINKF